MTRFEAPHREHDEPALRSRQIAALFSAKTSLWKTLDLASAMQSAIEAAVEATALDTGAIYLLNNNVLYLGATTPPLPPDFPDALRYAQAADHPHIMHAIDTEAPVHVADLAEATLTPQEQEITRVRDLRTILYVPLFIGDRAVGVFMVASTAEPKPLSRSEIIASQALAHSIALALDNAHLFDTLMQRAESLPHDIADRLRALACETAAADACAHEAGNGPDDMGARVRQRLTLLELRDEVQREESARTGTPYGSGTTPPIATIGSAAQSGSLDVNPAPFPPDSKTAHVLELGIIPALEFLARESGVGPSPDRIRVTRSAQMADADTTLLLFRAAREILDALSARPGALATSIVMHTDHRERVLLSITDNGYGLEPGPLGDLSDPGHRLSRLDEGLRRAGGELTLELVNEECVLVTAALPYLRYVP